MKKFFYLASVAIAALVVGCKDPNTEDPNNGNNPGGGDTPAEVTVTVEPEALSLAKTAGATATATVTSSSDILSAQVDFAATSWLSAKLEGNTLTVTAKSANTATTPRQGVVTICAGEGASSVEKNITVTQAEENEVAPTIELNTTTASMDSKEGYIFTVQITSNMTTFAAEVLTGAEWLKAEIVESSVVLTTLSANTASEARTGSVKVSAINASTNASVDATIEVTQSGAVATTGVKIGDIVQNGVLFWISEDGTKGKVLQPQAEKKPVAIDKTWIVEGAIDKEDGTVNVAAMKAFASTHGVAFAEAFPAAAYCESFGAGWYLPAQQELIALMVAYNGSTTSEELQKVLPNQLPAENLAARKNFDAILTGLTGGVAINSGADDANGDSAFCSNHKVQETLQPKWMTVRFGKYNCEHYDGNGTGRFARCIKVVDLQ